jgi:hypothetical protein
MEKAIKKKQKEILLVILSALLTYQIINRNFINDFKIN